MSSTLGFYVPRRQDDPPKILLWDIDEVAVFFLPLISGFMMGFFVEGLVAGVGARWLYLRLKVGRGPAYALHMLYWHTPSGLYKLRRTPPSHIREFTG